MTLREKIGEVLHQYYYNHHDKERMKEHFVQVIDQERADFLTKLISHVDSRIACHNLRDATLRDIRIAAKSCAYELEQMNEYLKRQRDKTTPEPTLQAPPDEL